MLATQAHRLDRLDRGGETRLRYQACPSNQMGSAVLRTMQLFRGVSIVLLLYRWAGGIATH